MDLAKIKNEIRQQMLADRDAMDREEVQKASSGIMDGIMALPEWAESDVLYIYASMGNEPDTYALINAALISGKKVCVPRVFGKEMRFIAIRSSSELLPGTFGLMEPPDGGVYEDTPGLVVVPGIAFGMDFYRVGFGAGYYDRFFEGHKKGDGWTLAAVCYDFQLLDSVPAEEFDVRMDKIVTPHRTYSPE